MKTENDWWFTYHDFYLVAENGHRYTPDWVNDVVSQANARLRAEREKMPVVYGFGEESQLWMPTNKRRDFGDATHQARLDGITEI